MREINSNIIRPGRMSIVVLLVALALALAPAASAQSAPTGTLSGIVQDQNGSVLPGVQVEVKHTGTALTRSATTNAEGRWTIPALPVGNYEVTYTLAGFRQLRMTEVAVEASVPRTLEAKLEVGDIAAETITVTGGGEVLATPETATIARQITAEQLVAVPTSTRSFTQLLNNRGRREHAISRPSSRTATATNRPSVNGTRTTSHQSLLQRRGRDQHHH